MTSTLRAIGGPGGGGGTASFTGSTGATGAAVTSLGAAATLGWSGSFIGGQHDEIPRTAANAASTRMRWSIRYRPFRMAVTRARPELGVVYTRREVCEPMVRLLLEPLLASGRHVTSLRICDPAIGEGAFVVEVVRVLAEAMGDSPRTRRLVAESCIHGVDVDPRAVAAARDAVERFVGSSVPALRDHLRVGDALSIEWPDKFDALVANPPYVRQELLANKQALRRFASYDGVADLYVYFIELALRIADRYCLIVPNKWMTAAYGRKLRDLLAGSGSVEGIVDFAEGLTLFEDADAFPCILWGQRGTRSEVAHATRVTTQISVAKALARTGAPHPRSRWTAEPWHIDTRADAELLAALRGRGPTLGELIGSRWSRGVVTGCNRAFVIDEAARAQLLADEPEAAALVRPFIKGRDIRRWRAAASERYVLLVDRGTSLAKLPRLRAHLAKFRDALEPRPPEHRGTWHGRKPGKYRWYELQDPVVPLAKSRAPRLLYQDIQTAAACALDTSGDLVPDTTVWILPSSDRFLLAVLCSPLYFWYARRRFPPALNGAVRPKLEYMRALPIATPPVALREEIERIVDAQLCEVDPERDAALADLVCTAYGLSPSERAVVGS
jgi:hypothetical protein